MRFGGVLWYFTVATVVSLHFECAETKMAETKMAWFMMKVEVEMLAKQKGWCRPLAHHAHATDLSKVRSPPVVSDHGKH